MLGSAALPGLRGTHGSVWISSLATFTAFVTQLSSQGDPEGYTILSPTYSWFTMASYEDFVPLAAVSSPTVLSRLPSIAITSSIMFILASISTSPPHCQAQSCTCTNCGGSHNAFYRGCPTYKFTPEVAILIFEVSLLLPMPVLHSAPVRPSQEVSTSQCLVLLPLLLPPLPVKFLATLNPHTPISIAIPDTAISTSPVLTPLPPLPTHRTRQAKRSTAPSPPSTSPSTPQRSVPFSPPHKKTFVSQTSSTNSTSETLEDIQNHQIRTQDNIPTPHPSSNLSAPIPATIGEWGHLLGFGCRHFEAIVDFKEVCDYHLSECEDLLECHLNKRWALQYLLI
ncbi:uncharacterized protein LOC119572544 [Penaeus monodon]|uniref:uncharacterized protein LOC119572544 n=1 Tax=Penaeus monodon TaxID=6687 RepID=UPI0018A795C4|nr:uncharacterized protein LOC119572544 [Penaeus monodon]